MTSIDAHKLIRGVGRPKARDILHDRGWTDDMILRVVEQHRLRGGLAKAAKELKRLSGIRIHRTTLGDMLHEIAAERQSGQAQN
jgi:hypothetical protein